MNKTKTYYQPAAYMDDGTNIEYGNIPEKLYSFQAFASVEECKEWLKDNGYDPKDYSIIEYHDDDIEDVTIIDWHGDAVEINEERPTAKPLYVLMFLAANRKPFAAEMTCIGIFRNLDDSVCSTIRHQIESDFDQTEEDEFSQGWEFNLGADELRKRMDEIPEDNGLLLWSTSNDEDDFFEYSLFRTKEI